MFNDRAACLVSSTNHERYLQICLFHIFNVSNNIFSFLALVIFSVEAPNQLAICLLMHGKIFINFSDWYY